MSEQKTSSLPIQLIVMALARLCLNTGLRMVYPFAPAFSRGLGISTTAFYRLVTIRNFAGFLSPFFGPLSERFGRKPIMMGTIILFSAGCLLVVLWPGYWPLGVTLSIIALMKVIYDPAMQAYVGETVPYSLRGRAIAVTELSWAGAMLAGAPFVSYIIVRQGWQAPFVWLGGLGLGAAVLLWRLLPRRQVARYSQGINLRGTWQVVRRHPVIWAATTYTFFIMTANETLFIVYGDWMEASFGLSLIGLGLSAGAIGGAEVVGEFIAGWSVDRLGKRPVVITAGCLNVLLTLTIPLTGASLTAAQTAYFALFLFFEITVVGAIPLLTEIVPDARSVVMSLVIAAGALGRATGSWLGPDLFRRFGFGSNGIVAAVLAAIGIVSLALWVRESQRPISTPASIKRR